MSSIAEPHSLFLRMWARYVAGRISLASALLNGATEQTLRQTCPLGVNTQGKKSGLGRGAPCGLRR